MRATSKTGKPERNKVTITYLEQKRRPSGAPMAVPAQPVAILKCQEPTADFYRFIYNAVGEPHKWVSRRYLNNDELIERIHRDDVEIFILYTHGWPGGFAEIDWSDKATPAIRFFGLVPEAQGLGLGRWFFHEVLGMIWAKSPQSVRIDTCTLDSPAALQLYQRAGFEVIDQRAGLIEWYG